MSKNNTGIDKSGLRLGIVDRVLLRMLSFNVIWYILMLFLGSWILLFCAIDMYMRSEIGTAGHIEHVHDFTGIEYLVLGPFLFVVVLVSSLLFARIFMHRHRGWAKVSNIWLTFSSVMVYMLHVAWYIDFSGYDNLFVSVFLNDAVFVGVVVFWLISLIFAFVCKRERSYDLGDRFEILRYASVGNVTNLAILLNMLLNMMFLVPYVLSYYVYVLVYPVMYVGLMYWGVSRLRDMDEK